VKVYVILLTLLAFVCVSCKREKKLKKIEAGEELLITSENEAEIVAFIEQLVTDANDSKGEKVAKAYDVRGFAYRALDDVELPEDEIDKFLGGFLKGFQGGLDARPGGLGWYLVGQQSKYIGMRSLDGKMLPLVRVFPEGGGADYVFFQMKTSSYGKPKVVDMFFLSNGEWASESTKRLVLPVLAQMKGPNSGKLFKSKKDEDFVKHIKSIKKITEAVEAGRLEEMKKLYHSLPDDLKEQRFLWGTYLSGLVDEPELHIAEAKKYEAAFPNDPSTAFMMIDVAYNSEDWSGLLTKVETIEKLVGADSYLQILRVDALVEQGSLEEGLL